MTKRDLFNVFIKLIALFSLFQVFMGLLVDLGYYFITMDNDYFTPSSQYSVFLNILWITVFLVIIFRTDLIINLMKLDEGFEEDYIYLEEINAVGIAKVSMIITGIVILINTLPELLQNLFISFKAENSSQYNIEKVSDFDWISSLFKLAAAYLLIANYTWLIKILKIDVKSDIVQTKTDTDILDDVDFEENV